MGLPLLLCGLATAQEAEKKPAFELKDGDRVVFLGDGFFDRERHYGYIETMLTRRFPGRHIQFRNLAWEGDSVDVQLRPLNFPSLEELLKPIDPTVVFISYGMNESFAGEGGLAPFAAAYRALLDRLGKTGRRCVLLTPMRQEKAAGTAGADVEARNRDLEAYAAAVQSLATERSWPCLDLFEWSRPGTSPESWTEDGIHPSKRAYASLALRIDESLGLAEAMNPKPPVVEGMAWRETADRIREAVVEKSRLWFHRWRAHNGEYIYGRRAKAFEGNSGNEQFPAEMAELERLIGEKEKEIFALAKPVPHTYELVPEK